MSFFAGNRTSDRARSAYVAALDVGSSKISCLIARSESGGALDIVGYGARASRGVRAGCVVDMDAVEEAVRDTIEEAERMAGAAVSRVSVGFSGGHLTSHGGIGVIEPADALVTARDQRRAIEVALAEFDEPGRSVLHAVPLSWIVDGQRGVRDPRGMACDELGVEVHLVSAADGPVRNLTMALQRARLDVRAIVAAPYASGLACLVPDELELGATVIDMGAGVTSAGVFMEGVLRHVDVIGVGGALASSDLARGLSTPLHVAEALKCEAATLCDRPEDDRVLLDCPQVGEEQTVARAPRSVLSQIIRPRVAETLEIIRDRLDEAGAFDLAGRRVVLTGGAAQLDGMAEFAARVLDKRVRVAAPRRAPGLMDADAGPAASTLVGLVRHALTCTGDFAPRPTATRPKPGSRIAAPAGFAMDRAGLSRAASWLRENF